MLRYSAASAAFKLFSFSPATRSYYRQFGNAFETWRRGREGLPKRYIDRVSLLLSCIEGHVDLSHDSHVLEIGTGFVHWESLICTLRADGQTTMYDIVDNRLFSTFQLYASELHAHLHEVGLPAERMEAARTILTGIREATSFDEVYSALSWRYVVDQSGTMDTLPDNYFDFVVSADVFEHVGREILPSALANTYRVTKPGGCIFLAIGLQDHLADFDPKAPVKCYYRFSGDVWERWFNSDVQYINRIQRSEWLSKFESAGLDCIYEDLIEKPHGVRTIHPSYEHLPLSDLNVTNQIVVLRKPG